MNYTIYPTLAPVSKRDSKIYKVECISKEELVQRIESIEERMASLEAMFKQLMPGNAPSPAASWSDTTLTAASTKETGSTKESVLSKGTASTSTAPVSTTLQLKKGDSFTFGKYQGEPVEWQVLDVEGGKALLLSRYGLDAKPYNEERKDVTWENCTLRQWLNQEFYKNAFSAGEQNRILKTNLVNADNPDYGTAGGNNTEDQVFLLSIEDSKKYFKDDSARKCIPTAYAKKQRAYVDKGKGTCYWWLRSPGYGSRYVAAVVSIGGSVSSYGHNVHYDDRVVRPALWINLKS